MSTLWNFLMNNAGAIGVIIGFVSLLASVVWHVSNRIYKAMQAADDHRMNEFKDYFDSQIAASEARLKDYVRSENAASEARLKSEIAASEARLKSEIATSETQLKSENATSEARLKDYIQSEIKSEITASEARLKEYFHAEISGVYSKIGEVDAKLGELDMKVGETVAVMKTKFEEIDRNISEVKNDVRAVWQPLINAFLMQKSFEETANEQWLS